MSDHVSLCPEKPATSQVIVLRADESEEEILAKLKTSPLDLSLKIAAAIGHLWQESEEDEGDG